MNLPTYSNVEYTSHAGRELVHFRDEPATHIWEATAAKCRKNCVRRRIFGRCRRKRRKKIRFPLVRLVIPLTKFVVFKNVCFKDSSSLFPDVNSERNWLVTVWYDLVLSL